MKAFSATVITQLPFIGKMISFLIVFFVLKLMALSSLRVAIVITNIWKFRKMVRQLPIFLSSNNLPLECTRNRLLYLEKSENDKNIEERRANMISMPSSLTLQELGERLAEFHNKKRGSNLT